MFRLIILALLIYLAVKLFSNLLKAPPPKSEVKGSPTDKKPIDLSGADIEDADFEEIDDA
jgi:hypothetical protein